MRRLFSFNGLVCAEAACLLALMRVALLLCPFRVVLRCVNRVSAPPAGLPSALDPIRMERVRWAVSRADRFVPGGRHCLTRALVAKLLVGGRRGSVDLRIGVARSDAGQLVAHAWLESNGAPVFGATRADVEQYSLLPHLDRG
jgi:hypothetical protein